MRSQILAPNLYTLTKIAGDDILEDIGNLFKDKKRFVETLGPYIGGEFAGKIHEPVSKVVNYLISNPETVKKNLPYIAPLIGFFGKPLVNTTLDFMKTRSMMNAAKQFAKPGVMALGGIGLGLGAASMMRNRDNYQNQGFQA